MKMGILRGKARARVKGVKEGREGYRKGSPTCLAELVSS